MSSAYWQTRRQAEHFGNGRTLTQRVADYIATWEARCYSAGIPDETLAKLARANRVPSYRAIAIAILRNDHQLHSLGFAERPNALVTELLRQRAAQESPQTSLWT